MSRKTPRFLYSHSSNTKSQGHYIIHCLKPRFIMLLCTKTPVPDTYSMYNQGMDGVKVYLLQFWDNEFIEWNLNSEQSTKIALLIADARKWASAQIKSGLITL